MIMKLLANINITTESKKKKKKTFPLLQKKYNLFLVLMRLFCIFSLEVCALLERTSKSLTLIPFAKFLIASVSLCRDLYGEYIVETLRR